MLETKKFRFNLQEVGFTLIELLLVISILAVIASLGLAFLQKRAEQQKVERSALQIQQLFEAGMAYYNDNSKWPDSNVLPDNTPPFVPYIPEGSKATPWGGDYEYVPVQVTTNTKKFRVCTPAMPHKVAERIKNMLPNAALYSVSADDACSATAALHPTFCSASDTHCIVGSEVVQGEGGGGGGGNGEIVEVGDVQFLDASQSCPDNKCANFSTTGIATVPGLSVSCPSGYQADMVAMPYVMERLPLGGADAVGIYPPLNISSTVVCSPNNGSNKSCDITGFFQGKKKQSDPLMSNFGRVLKVHYLAYCHKV